MPLKLKEYRRKRNFRRTPQTNGGNRLSQHNGIFVVQKHDASRLHYDFRLEIDGVLASWAVPKGPSLDPAAKRFATRTEDHPLEYANFEGVIPEGRYGAGTVMVWDTGICEAKDSMPLDKQLDRGAIKFVLHGKKLVGEFVLVRTGKRSDASREKLRWLLIKRRDEHANADWNIEDDDLNQSVLTRRTLGQIERERPARRQAA